MVVSISDYRVIIFLVQLILLQMEKVWIKKGTKRNMKNRSMSIYLSVGFVMLSIVSLYVDIELQVIVGLSMATWFLPQHKCWIRKLAFGMNNIIQCGIYNFIFSICCSNQYQRKSWDKRCNRRLKLIWRYKMGKCIKKSLIFLNPTLKIKTK